MGKSAITYIREGNKTAKKTFKKSKFNYIKAVFSSFFIGIGNLLIFLAPQVVLFKIRLMRIAVVKKDISVLHSLGGLNKKGTYSTILLSRFVIFALFLSGVLVISFFTFILYTLLACLLFGSIMGPFIYAENELALIPLIPIIPGGIALIIYIILFSMYFSAVDYLLDTNPEMGISNALFNSVDTFRRGGKLTLFVINLYYGFIELLLLALAIIPLIISNSIGNSSNISMIIGLVGSVFLIIDFILLPKLFIAHGTAKINLFNDIVFIREYDNRIDNLLSLYVTTNDKKELRSKNLKIEAQEELLSKLFNDTK